MEKLTQGISSGMLYIYPFITLQHPEITRSLLLYRYRRLDTARAAARAAGYKGAMFPHSRAAAAAEETQTVHESQIGAMDPG